MRQVQRWCTATLTAIALLGCHRRVDIIPSSQATRPDRTSAAAKHANADATEHAFFDFGKDRGQYDATYHLHDYRHEFDVDAPMVWVYLAHNVNIDGTQDPRSLRLVEVLMDQRYGSSADAFVRAFITGYKAGFASAGTTRRLPPAGQ